MGVPENHARFLKKKMGLDTFVEGGTYTGGTALLMSDSFQKVYTIEKSDEMYEIARKNIDAKQNITLLKGDTREHLGKILAENDNLLFWLDAHWSGGLTYGENDECPLIQELEIIFSKQKSFAILIDDARQFLAPPPIPHKHYNWPSLKEIINILPQEIDITVFEDVIYLIPDSISNEFKLYIQKEITRKWHEYHASKKGSISKGLRLAIKGLFNGKL